MSGWLWIRVFHLSTPTPSRSKEMFLLSQRYTKSIRTPIQKETDKGGDSRNLIFYKSYFC